MLFFVGLFFLILVECESKTDCPSRCVCSFDGNDTVSMNCSHRDWTHIPTNVSFPRSLLHLSLSYNRLSLLENDMFANLSQLRTLDVSYNLITRMEDLSFYGLISVQSLNLSFNNLQMTDEVYRKAIFNPLKNLQVLHLHGNSVGSSKTNYPDSALSGLVSLTYLSLDGLEGKVFGKGFQTLLHLNSLDLSGYNGYCFLSNITKATFLSLNNSRLSILDLSLCNIKLIEPGSYSMLKHLQYLDLSDNSYLTFSGMRNATYGLTATNISTLKCRRIDFYSNPDTLTKDKFEYLTNTSLRTLMINENRINVIEPDAIDYLPRSLESLSLRDNFIFDARFILRLVHLDNLRKFDVSYQLHYTTTVNKKLKRSLLPWQKMSNRNEKTAVKTINEFNFNDHRGQQIHLSNVWNSSKFMYAFNASGLGKVNPIPKASASDLKETVRIPFFQQFFNIQNDIQLPVSLEIVLSSNLKLQYPVPPVTFSKNSVKYLDCSANGLTSWLGKWKGLIDLEFLNISFNNFVLINPDSFGDMSKLTTLLLNDNKLGSTIMKDKQFLTFRNQTKLQILDLRGNGFKQLPEYMFASQKNLRILRLGQNILTSINFHIHFMVKLRELDLSDNDITGFTIRNTEEIDHIASQSNLTIDLTGNPLQCSCDQINQLKWMMDTNAKFKNYEEYICTYHNGTRVNLSLTNEIVEQLEIDCIAQEVVLICCFVFFMLLVFLSLSSLLYYKRSQSNLTIDLTGNPLQCSCDQINQLKWMMDTNAKFKNYEEYICTYHNGTRVNLSLTNEIVEQLEIDCIAQEVVLICCFVFFMLLVFLSLSSLLYYKRSRLKYLYAIGRKNYLPLAPDRGESLGGYAAYISVQPSERVNEFVDRMNEYMEKVDLSLCIPELHAPVGRREITNILSAMNQSACVVALIDNNYMETLHRLVEFDFAVMEGIRKKFKNLIVVLLEDLDERHFYREDIVPMFCRENHFYMAGKLPEETLFNDLKNEIVRYNAFQHQHN